MHQAVQQGWDELSPQTGTAPDGVVLLDRDALLVHEAAVRAAWVVQEGGAIRLPELQHGMQAADAGVLHGELRGAAGQPMCERATV